MKVLFLFGTRPEAIKLIPVIIAMRADPYFDVRICITAQHREMLDQVLEIFDIHPDEDLDLMMPNQTLAGLTARAIEGLERVVKRINPDICIIQGDTTTVLAAALVCFYNKITIAHVEAGLRTFTKYAPFPEEINRTIATQICDYHFAPTIKARENLLRENVDDSKILVTGNTVIDALIAIRGKIAGNNISINNSAVLHLMNSDIPFVLVTSHRRENFGEGIEFICKALKRFAQKYPSMNIVFPVHLNPNIHMPVHKMLKSSENIYLLEPLDYISFVALMSKCYLVLTDSGGVQEEAPGFGKPVLIMRDATERPEAVEAGLARLVGTDETNIFNSLVLLMEDANLYYSMSNGVNPFGDGMASQRIISFLKEKK